MYSSFVVQAGLFIEELGSPLVKSGVRISGIRLAIVSENIATTFVTTPLLNLNFSFESAFCLSLCNATIVGIIQQPLILRSVEKSKGLSVKSRWRRKRQLRLSRSGNQSTLTQFIIRRVSEARLRELCQHRALARKQ